MNAVPTGEDIWEYLFSRLKGDVPPALTPDVLADLAANIKEMSKPTIYRHKKRGTRYVLIGIGKMQAEHWRNRRRYQINEVLFETHYSSVDMAEVAIYRSLDDGELWVRPKDEFFDGRFVEDTPNGQ